MACSITDPNPLSCISSLAGSAAKAAAGDAFTAVAHYFGDAAEKATTWLWQTMGEATAVQIGGKGWAQDLGITVALALIVGTGLFLIQLIVSAVKTNMAGMGRAFRGLLVAFVAGGASIAITELLLQATDSLANGIMVAGTGESTWSSVGQKIVAATTINNISAPAVLLLVALVAVIASVIVWGALMIRKLLLIVTAIFAPVAFAGSLADITAGWVRKWIELTAALIFSKLILVIIFVVGLGVLDDGLGETTVGGGTPGHAAQSTTQLVTGCLILCMAGFAPWLAIKLVHFAGDSFHAMHTHAMAIQGAGQSAVTAPQKLAQRVGPSLSSGHPQPFVPRSQPQAQPKPSPGDNDGRGGPGTGTEGGRPVAASGPGANGGGSGAAGIAAVTVVEGGKAVKRAEQAAASTVSEAADGQSPSRHCGPAPSPQKPSQSSNGYAPLAASPPPPARS